MVRKAGQSCGLSHFTHNLVFDRRGIHWPTLSLKATDPYEEWQAAEQPYTTYDSWSHSQIDAFWPAPGGDSYSCLA